MINIGFIFPSSDYLFNPFKGDPHTHFQILTVLDWLFGRKVSLSLIDLRGIKREFAQYHIYECDIYLHSVYTLDYDEQLSIVNGLRQRYPKAKHIAGGPHAVVFKEESLKTFDSLIIGDGEDLIVEAVKDFMHSKLKKVYRQKAPVDIDVYPYPKRSFLPEASVAREGLMTLRNKIGYDKLLSTTVIFSRGCPAKCAFCSMHHTKKFDPGIRFRTPKLVEEEIRYLQRDYNIKGISLLDEIGFPLNRQKAIAYLEAIGKTGIIWRGQCRANSITPEIAKLLKDSGCITMCIGAESVSQKSLDIINKGIKVEQTREALHYLKQNGIETRLFMIIGLPAEPDDIVEKTWDFIKESSPDLVYLCLLTIRPGTEMCNNPKKYGIKSISNDWRKTMHLFSRYEKETPTLTFEYYKQTPWGKGFSSDRIVKNYMELQARILASNLGPL